jgi:hypothetical protein
MISQSGTVSLLIGPPVNNPKMDRLGMRTGQPLQAAQRPGASYPQFMTDNLVDPPLLVPEFNVRSPTLRRRLPPQTSCSASADSHSANYGIDLLNVFGTATRIYVVRATAL